MMFAGQGSGLLFAEMASDAPQNELSADAAPLSAPLSAPHSAPLSAPLSAPHAGAAPSQSGGLPDKSALFATPAVAVNDAALRAWRAQHNETLKKEAAEAQKRADDELARAKAELDKVTNPQALDVLLD
jgi:hypothetical protein